MMTSGGRHEKDCGDVFGLQDVPLSSVVGHEVPNFTAHGPRRTDHRVRIKLLDGNHAGQGIEIGVQMAGDQLHRGQAPFLSIRSLSVLYPLRNPLRAMTASHTDRTERSKSSSPPSLHRTKSLRAARSAEGRKKASRRGSSALSRFHYKAVNYLFFTCK